MILLLTDSWSTLCAAAAYDIDTTPPAPAPIKPQVPVPSKRMRATRLATATPGARPTARGTARDPSRSNYLVFTLYIDNKLKLMYVPVRLYDCTIDQYRIDKLNAYKLVQCPYVMYNVNVMYKLSLSTLVYFSLTAAPPVLELLSTCSNN